MQSRPSCFLVWARRRGRRALEDPRWRSVGRTEAGPQVLHRRPQLHLHRMNRGRLHRGLHHNLCRAASGCGALGPHGWESEVSGRPTSAAEWRPIRQQHMIAALGGVNEQGFSCRRDGCTIELPAHSSRTLPRPSSDTPDPHVHAAHSRECWRRECPADARFCKLPASLQLIWSPQLVQSRRMSSSGRRSVCGIAGAHASAGAHRAVAAHGITAAQIPIGMFSLERHNQHRMHPFAAYGAATGHSGSRYRPRNFKHSVWSYLSWHQASPDIALTPHVDPSEVSGEGWREAFEHLGGVAEDIGEDIGGNVVDAGEAALDAAADEVAKAGDTVGDFVADLF